MADMLMDTSGDQPVDTSDLYAVRRAKLEAMRAEGFDPFQQNWEASHSSAEAVARCAEGPEGTGPEVSTAGRIVAFRLMGKAAFVKIADRAGRVQLYFRRDEVGEEAYAAFKKLDIGDIIGVRGPLFRTKTGEATIRVQVYGLLAKSLRPLPEKWHGLTDNEQVYRQRYLDLIVNDESRKRFRQRVDIIRGVRSYLDARDFMEVETPVLQADAGGAAARPFVTHFNALDMAFYLRIALELYLKRLLVGGIDRVYELGRNFRNEGLSRRHNPEFTMLEVYQAYSDYRGMMKLIRGMIGELCSNVLGSEVVARPEGEEIHLGGNWREARYRDLVRAATDDADWFSRSKEHKLAACEKLDIEVNPSLEDFEIDNNVFEKKVEPTLIQPTFVTHLPRQLVPLAKDSADEPGTVDVFELCINGQEIAPAYSEQNDPIRQREVLEQQAGKETQKIDEDFLFALEHGMPPAGGMGVGIDRLIILLTGASNIRDVILFPAMRASNR